MSLEESYTTKDSYTCEQCQHVNVMKVKNVDARQKDRHMLLTDNLTWLLFKTEAAAAGKPLGAFLQILLKFYRANRERFNVPEVLG